MSTLTNDQLMDALTDAIAFTYSADKTSPGVVTSRLKKGYYVSIVRYEGAFGRDKKVVCHAKANSYGEALRSVANQFLNKTSQPKNPVQVLSEVVGNSK